MAEHRDSDWQALNAYADGELEGSARRDIARRLAYDPALSAQLAQIHSVKGALSLLRQEIETEPRPTRRPLGPRLALAVVMLAALALGTLRYLDGSERNWRGAPAELHASFSNKAYELPEAASLLVVSMPRIGDVQAIDLSAARLSLVDVATARRDGREIVAMHYRGRNGCRVTLVALEATTGGEPVLPIKEAGAAGLSAAWTEGRTHYTLMAGGMDRARFAAIRSYVQAETRRVAPRDELTLAMRSATDGARPCA